MQPLAHTHKEGKSEIKMAEPVVWDKNSLNFEIN